MRNSTRACPIYVFPFAVQRQMLHCSAVHAYLQGTCWEILPVIASRHSLVAVGGVGMSP
jgi:hypothetical protein